MSFVHLHVHSEYSLLDGACRMSELTAQAKALGMPAVALTDHGNLYGVIEFYQAAQAAGIKPIIGCEMYVTDGKMSERNANENRHHFLLLAKNNTGYQNLVQLVTTSHLEGIYYKPRVDKELLDKHREGLIATTACLHSEPAHFILAGKLKEAEKAIRSYQEIFAPEDFYLEIHNHGFAEEEQVRARYADFSKKLKVPLVAANDVHFLKREHAETHDILICIQTAAKLAEEKRMRSPGPEFYLKSPEEMAELFADHPEALENTLAIAERCGVEIELGKNKYPTYEPPAGQTREAYLRDLCRKGLEERYGTRAMEPELRERLEYEISVIEKMGFVSYFLIVWDFIDHARQQGIPVGPGRGSAAGSLVAYCLQITQLDPLRYGLLFERFLNPERISPPDIDVDFCQNRREEVIQYVRQKYGERAVAQIITYGTMGAKMAVRDVARVMGLSFTEASRIADMIPRDPKMTIEKALKISSEFRQIYEDEDITREVVDHAIRLEGLTRQTGIHAAGVVIGEGDLTQYLPLTRGDDGGIVTQYAMEPVGDIGLLKMDFLGLKTLTVIQDCLNLVEQSTGQKISSEEIPLDDPATFALLNRAENIGVFQVESPGMRRTCQIFDIQTIDDIIALIALYRPGPMDLIDEYVKRKKGLVEFQYEHPLLKKVCADTHGIMIYQEQVMSAARLLAGYSMGEADLLRRAMGKKKKEEMDKQRNIFIQGCGEKNAIPPEQANRIFDLLEKFAGYGFNKSHSAAYGLIAYHTAYLKANYPVSFMAALLSNELDNTDKIALFVTEANQMGIEILPPSVNDSELRFTVGKKSIRYGLGAIKNVGFGAVEAALKARAEEGAFTSLEDFCRRVEFRAINKKTVESLVRAGAFDCIHPNRAALFDQIDMAMSKASSLAHDAEKGQNSFFDILDEPAQSEPAPLPDVPEWPWRQRLGYEKELLGFYITGHPAEEYEADLRGFRTVQLGDAKELEDDSLIRIAGVITGIEIRTTQRDGRPYARLQIEDPTGRLEVMVFPNQYTEIGALLEEGVPLVISGQMEFQDDQPPKFRTNDILTLERACERLVKEIHIVIPSDSSAETLFPKIQDILKNASGQQPVCFEMPSKKGTVLLEAGSEYRVRADLETITRLRETVGKDQIKLRTRNVTETARNNGNRRRFARKTG